MPIEIYQAVHACTDISTHIHTCKMQETVTFSLAQVLQVQPNMVVIIEKKERGNAASGMGYGTDVAFKVSLCTVCMLCIAGGSLCYLL